MILVLAFLGIPEVQPARPSRAPAPFSGSPAPPGRAEAHAAAREAADPVGYAFETLDSVAQGSYTRRSIVYGLKAGRVHWRTRENRKVRFVKLSFFNLSCSAPVELLGIEKGEGDVTRRFAEHRPEANRKLVASSVRQTDFLKGLPPEVVAQTAAHPETTSCVPLTSGQRRRPRTTEGAVP